MSVAAQVASRVGAEPRPPCSDAERRAAIRLRAWLRARGDDARIEPAWLRPQSLAATGVAALIGVAGSVASLWSPVAGVACAAVAAVVLALEAAGYASPLRWAFPRRATQDVIVAPARDDGVTLLVTARYDSPRRGLASTRTAQRLVARARRRWLPGARGWLVLAALAIAAAAAARSKGAEGVPLGAAQLVPSLVLLAAAAAALDAGLAGWGPGDALAAAVGAAVAIHDELVQQPAGALVPALLIYGAGATGPQQLRARLKQLAPDPRNAVVLEVMPLGSGPPRWRSSHSDLRAAAARAAAALDAPADAPPLPRPPRLGRLGVIRTGTGETGSAGDAELEGAVELALTIADALDGALQERRAATAA